MIPVPSKDAVQEVSAPVIGRTARELRESTPPKPDWLVPGVLARGAVTELNGREKIGKGWFEAYLIARLEHDAPTLFGPNALEHPVKTLIYTEEPDQSLREKFEQFDINDAFVIYQWELAVHKWSEIVDYLVKQAVDGGYGLVFIDNISAATGTEDENGVELARKVEPLGRKAKEYHLAVLYDRHQRKSSGKIEDLARGGTALAGAVDQIIAMEKGADRERKLTSWGRLWESNWSKTVELNEDHTDYGDLGVADYKERILMEREEWTVKDFAEAIAQSDESARIYLDGSPLVVKRKQKRGNAHIYDVIKPPELG